MNHPTNGALKPANRAKAMTEKIMLALDVASKESSYICVDRFCHMTGTDSLYMCHMYRIRFFGINRLQLV